METGVIDQGRGKGGYRPGEGKGGPGLMGCGGAQNFGGSIHIFELKIPFWSLNKHLVTRPRRPTRAPGVLQQYMPCALAPPFLSKCSKSAI